MHIAISPKSLTVIASDLKAYRNRITHAMHTMCGHLYRHDTSTHAGPQSSTLAQHLINSGLKLRMNTPAALHCGVSG